MFQKPDSNVAGDIEMQGKIQDEIGAINQMTQHQSSSNKIYSMNNNNNKQFQEENSEMTSEVLQMQMQNNLTEEDEILQYNKDEIISIRNVHKTYLLGVEGVTALRGVSFDVKEGEFIIILGTSGGGKTSLLNIMGTIDKPTKGDVYICGQKIKSSTQDKFLASLRLVRLGFVFQTFNLIQSLTAIENVELPMILRGKLSRLQIRQRAKMLLEKVGLKDRLGSFPNMLSGGEQQRVTIVRALANEPKILLLDEPTGDLDTKNSDLVMKILLDLNVQDKITMIMVTHDVQLKQYANRIVKISDGKIVGIQEMDPNERKVALENLKKVVEGKEIEGEKTGVRSGLAQVDDKQQKIFDQEENQLKQIVQGGSKTKFRKGNHYAVINFSNQQYFMRQQSQTQKQ